MPGTSSRKLSFLLFPVKFTIVASNKISSTTEGEIINQIIATYIITDDLLKLGYLKTTVGFSK